MKRFDDLYRKQNGGETRELEKVGIVLFLLLLCIYIYIIIQTYHNLIGAQNLWMGFILGFLLYVYQLV